MGLLYLLPSSVDGLYSNVVISEVDALVYVALSEVEKKVSFGESVGTTECITL